MSFELRAVSQEKKTIITGDFSPYKQGFAFYLLKKANEKFQRVKNLAKRICHCYQVLRPNKSFPSSEKFCLGQQVTNAAVSIPSNVAEGSSRSSIKDQCRFMEIALGSSYKLETQLHIAKAVEFGSMDVNVVLLKELDEEQKMLMGFINKSKGKLILGEARG